MSQCKATVRDGTRCERPATEGDYCWQHCKDKRQEIRALKDAFIEEYTSAPTSVTAAADRAGIARQTVYRWRHEDAEFNKRMEKAQDVQDDLRAEKVEQSAINQALEGEASGSLMIFLLKVYGGEKFRQADQRSINMDDQRTDPAMADLANKTAKELDGITEEAEKASEPDKETAESG